MKSTLFMVNIVLSTKLRKLKEELSYLKDCLNQYRKHGVPQRIQKSKPEGQKRKRKRKKKSEVIRKFDCCVDNCLKSYGSENSLNQHMKIKHPEFWNMIKKKEANLLCYESGYKSREKVFGDESLGFDSGVVVGASRRKGYPTARLSGIEGSGVVIDAEGSRLRRAGSRNK